jgi:ABC-type lipoprotein release transport system permease subunit
VLSLRIALRYLLSRKSHNAINVISAISLAAIAVAAMAMVIVLSVFNGFSRLAEGKLSHLNPDYLITPVEGKAIGGIDSLTTVLQAIEGVDYAAGEITEQAFAVAYDRQIPVTIKGMQLKALAHTGIRDIIVDGEAPANEAEALLSAGVAVNLNLRPSARVDSIAIYEPRRVGRINPANPMAAFRSATVAGTGVYQMEQDDYDRDMIIVPFATAARLLSYDDQATGIAVYLTPTASRATIAALQQLCEQQNLNLKDRHRQQEQAFRMIAIEKWITFLMLAFILVIASFNIISTLSMLIIEKEGNMNILRAMGAGRRMLSGIFVWQGWLIVILGGIVGIALGALLVALQQQFGWIKLGGADTSLLSVDTYPVELQFTDIAVTLLTIAAVALLISPIIPLIRRNKE